MWRELGVGDLGHLCFGETMEGGTESVMGAASGIERGIEGGIGTEEEPAVATGPAANVAVADT